MMSNNAETCHPTLSEVEAFLTSLLHTVESQTPAKAFYSLTGESRNLSDQTNTKPKPQSDTSIPPATPSDSPKDAIPTSHVLLAPSITPNLLHALNHPPSNAPPNSAPLAFLLRPPPTLHGLLNNPHTLLLSDQSAISSHLHLNFNVPLAAELGVDTTTALPLYDPSPHRRGQTIGLVGGIADVEGAAKYRFQSKQLEERLRSMVGGHAPQVNRVSDVFWLCVGVSEDGAIGVFDFTDSRTKKSASARNGGGNGNDILEEDEDEGIEMPDTPQHEVSETAAPTTITALAFSRSFDAQTIEQAHSIAKTAGFLPTENSRLLFVTPQPRQAGLAAAEAKKMLVMCVTNIAANLWALRYLSRKIKEQWPDLEVKMIPK